MEATEPQLVAWVFPGIGDLSTERRAKTLTSAAHSSLVTKMGSSG